MVVRGRDGIWNQHVLPVTDWEDPYQRIVLPSQLRRSLKRPVPDVLRWDCERYLSVTIEHAMDPPVMREFTRHLAHWQFHGEESGEHAENQRILFQDADGRWYAVSIGPLTGSDNIITISGSRRNGFLSNR